MIPRKLLRNWLINIFQLKIFTASQMLLIYVIKGCLFFSYLPYYVFVCSLISGTVNLLEFYYFIRPFDITRSKYCCSKMVKNFEYIFKKIVKNFNWKTWKNIVTKSVKAIIVIYISFCRNVLNFLKYKKKKFIDLSFSFRRKRYINSKNKLSLTNTNSKTPKN